MGMPHFTSYMLLDILAICIFLIIGLRLCKQKTPITIPRLYFVWISLLLYFFTDLVRASLIANEASLNTIIIFIDIQYIINGLLGYFWILYMGKIMNYSFYKKNISYFISAIIPAIYIALIIANKFTGIIYSVVDGKLVFNSLNIITWFVSSIDVVTLSIIVLIKACGKEYFGFRRLYLILGSFGIVVAAAKLLEKVFQVPIVNLVLILMSLLMFIEALENIISIDQLTGINNKGSLIKYLNKLIKSKIDFYFAIIDIDNFKSVNDVYGHLEGDNAIKILTDVLVQFPNFFVARYGGDEFCLVTTFTNMKQTKEMINGALKEICDKKNIKYPLTVSLGSATYKGQYHTVYDLIMVADSKLYEDKKKKINNINKRPIITRQKNK